MKYVTGYLNYPKNLFFKIKLYKNNIKWIYIIYFTFILLVIKKYTIRYEKNKWIVTQRNFMFGKIGFIWNISSKLSPIRDLAFPNARLREIENRFARTSIMRWTRLTRLSVDFDPETMKPCPCFAFMIQVHKPFARVAWRPR